MRRLSSLEDTPTAHDAASAGAAAVSAGSRAEFNEKLGDARLRNEVASMMQAAQQRRCLERSRGIKALRDLRHSVSGCPLRRIVARFDGFQTGVGTNLVLALAKIGVFLAFLRRHALIATVSGSCEKNTSRSRPRLEAGEP